MLNKLKKIHKIISIIILLNILLILNNCGHKGPLYLPKNNLNYKNIELLKNINNK